MERNLADLLVFVLLNLHNIDPQKLNQLRMQLQDIKEDITIVQDIKFGAPSRIQPLAFKK